ncbi:MAG: Na+/H+ antiporter NhaC family protein [Verrucomicrobiota bacterium JB023]|nr:Na+/H+ antiporter NhaC family protein [Verrucomicrobiota bacterium JB023]
MPRWKSTTTLAAITLIALALLLAVVPSGRPLAPPLLAGGLLLLTRSAAGSLFGGSLLGALLAAGSFWQAPSDWVTRYAWPSLTSSWHAAAMGYTLLLAAFAAVVERSGAISALLARWTRSATSSSRFETSVVLLGLFCFFDGLANALMLGRVGRKLADQSGVSREKLAYLVDTTSSAVACVAFISTWSVVQLSLIGEALSTMDSPPAAYLVFLRSIPLNFYCLLSLILVFLAAKWGWNPPPMARAKPLSASTHSTPARQIAKPLTPALGPLLVLLLSVPLSFWILGNPGRILPSSTKDIQLAFSTSKGPWALILAGLLSLSGAILFYPGSRREVWPAILEGMRSMLPALLVLLMAWTLGATLGELGTAKTLATQLGDNLAARWLPGATFILACLIAFATGSSWGTMSLLIPIALGTLLSLAANQDLPPAELQALLPAVTAAVFGGAVFGDHASPFSDTTIVSAMACDVTTTRHVATQLPYALTAGGIAIAVGYLPTAFGLSGWASLLLATAVLIVIVRSTRPRWGTGEAAL